MHQNTSSPSSNCVAKLFGILPDGREVNAYTLSNTSGMEVNIINYGATITSLKVPNTNGSITDVVLGFDTIEGYINSFSLPGAPYFGSVVGRYAGRINGATFNIDGTQYSLAANNNGNTLHGGKIGFSRAYWQMQHLHGGENPSITLRYISRDGEENFPGELTVDVTYTLTETNDLLVSYSTTTTKPTVINLTQHSYFNLEGHSRSINAQKLHIHSDKVLELEPDGIPTGNIIDVNGTELDFTNQSPCPQSIDNSFIITNHDQPAASLYSALTGIKMTVYTNQPSVHTYVGGNCFDMIKGKDGVDYSSTSGICFETQNYPDAPNQPDFPKSVLRVGDTYVHETRFAFTNGR
jgi:aldose 1-epimerase